MPATWTQLKDAVAGLIGDPDYTGVSGAVVEEAILTVARELAVDLKLTVETSTISTAANTEDYLLDATPTGGSWGGVPFRVRRAMVLVSNYNYRELREATRRVAPASPVYGIPTHYTLRPQYSTTGDALVGPRLSLWPIPNAIYTVKLLMYVLPGDSTAYPNGPGVPAEAEMLLMTRSAKRLLSAYGNTSLLSDLESEEEGEVKAIRGGREKAVRGVSCRRA